MNRFAVFIAIIILSASSFYFFKNKKELSFPLKSISLENYSLEYPKNVTYVNVNPSDPDEFIVVLNNGYVFEDGRVITQNGEILEAVSVLKYGNMMHNNPLLKRKDFPKPKKFGGTLAVIASIGEANYYHWVFQILPRIKLLQESKIPFDKLYVYDLKLPYQKNSIKLLGIPEEKIYSGTGEIFIQAEKLLVPSIAVQPALGKKFPSWVIKFLNDSFLVKSANVTYPKKIFISRNLAKYRRIVNEEELMKAIEPLGYKRIMLENLKLSEQAELFHNAESIIAVHGSGLSNLVFCQKGTQVIEINAHDGHRGPYRMLAQQMMLDYKSVDTSADLLTERHLENDDVVIDVSTVITNLN